MKSGSGLVPQLAYKVPEAAEALALSVATVWKLVKSGELRSYKVGSSRFIPVAALTEFVEARLAEQPIPGCCGNHPDFT
ncbi:helix-turn-helix domain-containing protein [Nocardiopsis sp. CA-288880]|uniref:helix-turn-helix domain-containing protein n=1 Tax=Nocardiopsis sp. CA-288880 TaxID=3239995 RepID=UPI003D99BC79